MNNGKLTLQDRVLFGLTKRMVKKEVKKGTLSPDDKMADHEKLKFNTGMGLFGLASGFFILTFSITTIWVPIVSILGLLAFLIFAKKPLTDRARSFIIGLIPALIILVIALLAHFTEGSVW